MQAPVNRKRMLQPYACFLLPFIPSHLQQYIQIITRISKKGLDQGCCQCISYYTSYRFRNAPLVTSDVSLFTDGLIAKRDWLGERNIVIE